MRRRMEIAALLAGMLCAFSIPTHAAGAEARAGTKIQGVVVNSSGQTLNGVTVTLAERQETSTTDAQGRFLFTGVLPGRYTLTFSKVGYRSTTRTPTVADTPIVLNIALQISFSRIEPVNITATREPVAAVASPLQTSVLSAEDLHPDGGISLAHAVAQLPGVRSVTSGQQIGKPMVRGLFGPRVLVLADGSRIEDYSWSDEDGPSIDARMAQRIEVIRGPASVLYGSEALGGVVNVVPAAVSFSAEGERRRNAAIEAYGGSNNFEVGGAGMLEGSQSKYGWRALVTGRAGQNYETPSGTMQNSSFWAFNGEGAFGIRGDRSNTTIRGAHYGGEFHLLEASGPEPDDPTGGPVRQTLDDRIQVTNEYVAGNNIRFETKAQWQRHSLAEVSDDCQPAPGQTTCVKVKDKQAFGLVLNTGTIDLLAHHSVGEHLTGTLGVSGMYQLSSTSGPIFLVPSATTTSAGAFAFEQATFGIVSVVGGVRGDTRSLSSDASALLALSADDRTWSAASGDLGVVVRPTEELALVANYGTGWRAPTLFDLYTNGPNQADARYEIGDPTLKTERSYNIDGGVRWNSARARAEASVYQNSVDDFIFTAPTAQTISGLRVFRHRQTDARLTGAEFSAAFDVADPLTVHGSYDYVNGTDRITDAPLPLMPPPRTIVGADLHSSHLGWAQRASIGAEVENDAKQTRLDPNDVSTNAYTLLNLTASMERVVRARPFRFEFYVHNATNTSYRDFLSRYKGFALSPGVNVVFKVSTGAW